MVTLTILSVIKLLVMSSFANQYPHPHMVCQDLCACKYMSLPQSQCTKKNLWKSQRTEFICRYSNEKNNSMT